MPFFAPEHVQLALQYLPDHTHPSLVSLLAMLRERVPAKGVDEAVPFGSEQEHALLDRYFAPPGGTKDRPWYLPFGKKRDGIPTWKTNDYGGSSLQRMRRGKPWIYPALLDESGKSAIGFALPENLKEVLEDRAGDVIGGIPLSIHHLAAWMYRDEPIATHAAAIQRFIEEFCLSNYDLLGSVFSNKEDPALGALPLRAAPISTDELSALLESQPQELLPQEGQEPSLPEDQTTTAGSWDIDRAKLTAALGSLVGVEDAALQALSALRAGMHVVFTGAPGSGKTELAQRVCKAAEFEPWVVTATDSWTTFETIGGYFPQLVDGQEQLDFEPGLIVSAMAEGKILIIDEINRADIDKAFGELFTLLSGTSVTLPFRRSGRGEDTGKRVRLQVPGDPAAVDTAVIPVPDWWRMVGAMNDADKASLKRLSFAFMRRFAFVPVPLPTPEAYAELISEAGIASGLSTSRPDYVHILSAIFAHEDGLRGLDLAMGFAIPKAMVRQALAELGLDAERSSHALISSGLELYLAPQLQGRADKHGEVLALLEGHLDAASLTRFEGALANWTGFMA